MQFNDWNHQIFRCRLDSCQSSTNQSEKSRAVSVSSLFPKERKTHVEGIFRCFRHFHGVLNGKANSLRKDAWKQGFNHLSSFGYFSIFYLFRLYHPYEINIIQCEEIDLKKEGLITFIKAI